MGERVRERERKTFETVSYHKERCSHYNTHTYTLPTSRALCNAQLYTLPTSRALCNAQQHRNFISLSPPPTKYPAPTSCSSR